MKQDLFLDFDKVFEKYVMEWYKDNASQFQTIEEMEEIMPELYDKWAGTPNVILGGISPYDFFHGIDNPKDLVEILVGSSEGDTNPCSLLLDRIGEVKECSEHLVDIIVKNRNEKLTMICINLLTELGAEQPLDTYVDWLAQPIDIDLKELAVETLCEHADKVSKRLIPLIKDANIELKTVLAEILVNAKKNDSTYDLLMELFNLGDNIPLYAGYIGKYGDERAATTLYRALKDSNYLEYLEIKNAIERLGGIVEDTRDFRDDVYYEAIKGLK